MKHWWQTFFDHDYLDLYVDQLTLEQTEHEILFLNAILKTHGVSRVLDLACGQGRHSIELAKEGYKITGLDYSAELIEVAKFKARKHNVEVDFIQADMRELPLDKGSYDAVINMFTSFGFFEKESDDEKVVSECSKILRHEGLFVLDLKNIFRLIENPQYSQKRTLSNGIRIASTGNYDPRSQKWTVSIEWEVNDVVNKKDYNLRLYTLDEIKSLLEKYGMSVVNVYGSYECAPYTKESRRMIVLGKKCND